MVWSVVIVVALLYLAVLRYGADSRDGLDWRTSVLPLPRRPEYRRDPSRSPRADLARLIGLLRSGAKWGLR